MKKIGGVLLVILGIALILIAILRAVNTVLIFFSAETSAYGIGFLVGTIFVVVLFTLLGIKSFKKGRQLISKSEISDTSATKSEIDNEQNT